jgi:hypothetical protein
MKHITKLLALTKAYFILLVSGWHTLELTPPNKRVQVKDINGNSVSLNKPISHSGIFNGDGMFESSNPSQVTNDVDSISRYPNIYCSDTAGSTEYLEVDLGEEYTIGSVKYWNRGDTCMTRSANTSIQLLNNDRTVVGSKTLTGNLESEIFNLSKTISVCPYPTLNPFNWDN